jgi:hypothetical protein
MWIDALKTWNEHKKKIDASHVWAVPRRGTPEHEAVSRIMRDRKSLAERKKKMDAAKPGKAEKEEKERKPTMEDFFRR